MRRYQVNKIIPAKEQIYRREELFLSQYAVMSKNTKGRSREEQPCPLRTDFQRDRDRIIHCKAFRRLKNKTQVFLSPEGDHYRTRLTHTLDVTQIARTIARALSLNEDLAEAIALGHDLGHTPFGHSGEHILNELSGHFEHNEQSLRVIEVLENDGAGLNLTYEVRDGILNHKKSGKPATLEGKVVSYADRIAYINHDIDDSIRAEVLRPEDLPQDDIAVLGYSASERINTMVTSIYRMSAGSAYVKMEENVERAADNIRAFMFERVYTAGKSKAKLEEIKAHRMLTVMYDYFMSNIDKLPSFYHSLIDIYGKKQAVCDYISSMSDKYAVYMFESLFVPSSWNISL